VNQGIKRESLWQVKHGIVCVWFVGGWVGWWMWPQHL